MNVSSSGNSMLEGLDGDRRWGYWLLVIWPSQETPTQSSHVCFFLAQWCLAVHNCPVHIQHLSTFCAAQPKDGRKPLIGIPFPF